MNESQVLACTQHIFDPVASTKISPSAFSRLRAREAGDHTPVASSPTAVAPSLANGSVSSPAPPLLTAWC